MKPWHKSKTIWFSLLLAMTGAIPQLLPAVQEQLTPEAYGLILFFAGLMSATLRVVTTQGITK